MTRVVLDTNVLVSGMIHPRGPPGRIVDLLREGAVELVVDDRVLAEYADVIQRPKFDRYMTNQDRMDILLFLREDALYVVANSHSLSLPDPDDAPFLDVAAAARVPLITGNAEHFPRSVRRGVEVLTPAAFVVRMSPR